MAFTRKTQKWLVGIASAASFTALLTFIDGKILAESTHPTSTAGASSSSTDTLKTGGSGSAEQQVHVFIHSKQTMADIESFTPQQKMQRDQQLNQLDWHSNIPQVDNSYTAPAPTRRSERRTRRS